MTERQFDPERSKLRLEIWKTRQARYLAEDLAKRKAEADSSRDLADALRERRNVRFRAECDAWVTAKGRMYGMQTQLASGLMRTLVLINGGGVIVLLTFIGHLSRRDDVWADQLLPNLSVSIKWFIVGVVAAALAGGFAALAQKFYIETKQGTWLGRAKATTADVLVWICVLACLLSVASFGCGSWTASGALDGQAWKTMESPPV
jgi:hypothetical protein